MRDTFSPEYLESMRNFYRFFTGLFFFMDVVVTLAFSFGRLYNAFDGWSNALLCTLIVAVVIAFTVNFYSYSMSYDRRLREAIARKIMES